MKKVFLFIAIGLLLIGIPATIYLLGQQNDLRAKAAPATTLSLIPAQSAHAVGTTFNLNVQIDPGSNQVRTAKIAVTFDPAKLKAMTITNGPKAPRILSAGVVEPGRAYIVVGAANNAQPITSAGTIAVIKFKAMEATTATPAAVKFEAKPKTFVGARQEGTNVLVTANDAKITITGESGITPTPTVTLTPTITTTITPTITVTPTTTVTPTLTVTPTPNENTGTNATSSALQILSPAENANVTSTAPTFQGKAPPGSTVTIVIYSTPQTVTVTTDANGNWTYTPTTSLEEGPHSVVASIQTAADSTEATTSAFVVVASGTGGGVSADDAMPISGNAETTVILIALGLVFLAGGILLPMIL